jgi:hypothetical protein
MSSKLDCADRVTNEEPTEQFVERLGTISLADWVSIAASVAQTARERAEANEALERIVAQHSLAVDAWSIGDDVETAVHYSVGANGDALSPRDCLSLSAARQAAATAAVALFVRPLLATRDFEVLYRPFASLAPLNHERWERRRRDRVRGTSLRKAIQ